VLFTTKREHWHSSNSQGLQVWAPATKLEGQLLPLDVFQAMPQLRKASSSKGVCSAPWEILAYKGRVFNTGSVAVTHCITA